MNSQVAQRSPTWMKWYPMMVRASARITTGRTDTNVLVPGNSDWITSPPRMVLKTLNPMNRRTATTTGRSEP